MSIYIGDYREVMCRLISEGVKVDMCVTSPPYFGLRDYGHQGQLGLESTPDEYIASLVEVFRLVRELLTNDGTLWLNIGDSYANVGKWGGHTGGKHAAALHCTPIGRNKRYAGLKPKDLIGIPWMLAFALRADGWYLRQTMPWIKRNPMPEGVKDRPTCSTETFFMLKKSHTCYYDYEAVQRRMADSTLTDKRTHDDAYQTDRIERGYPGPAQHGGGMLKRTSDKQRGHGRRHQGFNERWDGQTKQEQGQTRAFRNCDLYYESLHAPHGLIQNAEGDFLGIDCATKPYTGAHFATFPPRLIEPLILASCPPGGIVLDPFLGSGTTGEVAEKLQREWIGIDINPEYQSLQLARTAQMGLR